MSTELIKLSLPTSDAYILKILATINPAKTGDHDRYIIRGGVTHGHAWEEIRRDFGLNEDQAQLCMGGYLRMEQSGEIAVIPGSDSHRDLSAQKIVVALSHFYPNMRFCVA